MFFAEFCAMYLLCWSDELWPRVDGVAAAPMDLEAAYGEPKASEDDPRAKKIELAKRVAVEQRWHLAEFASTLPRVRRALANVPAYMMFDDHELSDDWNIDTKWVKESRSDPVLHRIVRNALVSMALFQAWGNDPPRFVGGSGLALLDLVTVPAGQAAPPLAGAPDAADLLLNIAATEASPAGQRLDWDWVIDGPEHRVIALDTRTRRDFVTAGPTRAGLLTTGEMQRQLSSRRRASGDTRLCVVISPAPVIGHPLVEEVAQPLYARFKNSRGADNEAWSVNRKAFENLLSRLAAFGAVVLLSGDVHYGYTNQTAYFGARGQQPARLVQMCSSAAKNADPLTRGIGNAGHELAVDRGWFGLSAALDHDKEIELRAAVLAGAEGRSLDAVFRWLVIDTTLLDRFSVPVVLPAGPWGTAWALDLVKALLTGRPDDWSYRTTLVRDVRAPAQRLVDAYVTVTSSTPQVVKHQIATPQ